jgi:ribonuclease HI
MAKVVAIFADGGCVERNPSPIAGTWAWCHVSEEDERCRQESGLEPAAEWPGGMVTNNQMEFVALVRAIEALPSGWTGTVHSDSKVSLGRLFRGWKLTGIPPVWRQRGSLALGRIGQVTVVLLDGHPTRAQLLAGRGKRGNPVSPHNVWCDRACGDAGRLAAVGAA